MALPAQAYVGDVLRTHGEMQTALEDIRDAVAQVPGVGVAVQQLTCSAATAASITPVEGESHIIDVQGFGGNNSTLRTIVTGTAVIEGALVVLYPGTPGTENITVEHAGGGADDINLIDATDFVMNAAGMSLCLRYNGTDWDEMGREWGDQTTATTAALTFAGLGDAATKTVGSAAANVPLGSDIFGEQTVYIPAGAMKAPVTDGATAAAFAGTNKEFDVFDFDGGATQEFVQFTIILPKSWDVGTVNARFYFMVGATTANAVRFGISLDAVATDAAIDGAFPSSTYVAHTLGGGYAADEQVVTAYTAAVTVQNAAADTLIYVRVDRDPTDPGDTVTQDARLIGVDLTYTTNALNDD